VRSSRTAYGIAANGEIIPHLRTKVELRSSRCWKR